jgi:integration host factor subunit beta
MTKRELVIDVAAKLGQPQHDVAAIVQATMDTIVESLAEGHRLEIRNFGVFDVRTRDPRQGRNPRTGDSVAIAAKKVPGFKPGKALKHWVQTGVRVLEDGEPAIGAASLNPIIPSGLEPRSVTSSMTDDAEKQQILF